jgi:hypothetical protein
VESTMECWAVLLNTRCKLQSQKWWSTKAPNGYAHILINPADHQPPLLFVPMSRL